MGLEKSLEESLERSLEKGLKESLERSLNRGLNECQETAFEPGSKTASLAGTASTIAKPQATRLEETLEKG